MGKLKWFKAVQEYLKLLYKLDGMMKAELGDSEEAGKIRSYMNEYWKEIPDDLHSFLRIISAKLDD